MSGLDSKKPFRVNYDVQKYSFLLKYNVLTITENKQLITFVLNTSIAKKMKIQKPYYMCIPNILILCASALTCQTRIKIIV